jgi:hypothetical protein
MYDRAVHGRRVPGSGADYCANLDVNRDLCANVHGDPYTHAHCHDDVYLDAYSYADARADEYGDGYQHPNADQDSDPNQDFNAGPDLYAGGLPLRG